MKNLENTINSPQTFKGWKSFGAKVIICAAACLPAVFGTGCNDDGGGGGGGTEHHPPYASISASPYYGEKPLTTRIDASASTAETGIVEFAFDFDNDGTIDYSEAPDNAPDGKFDGITTADYSSEGDYIASVRVTDSGGKTGAASEDVKVGFGDDWMGAVDYIEELLSGCSYECTRDQDFLVINPETGQMVGFTADIKAEFSGDVTYIIYDPSTLTLEQYASLIARESAGMEEPKVRLVMRSDSPLTIEDLLFYSE